MSWLVMRYWIDEILCQKIALWAFVFTEMTLYVLEILIGIDGRLAWANHAIDSWAQTRCNWNLKIWMLRCIVASISVAGFEDFIAQSAVARTNINIPQFVQCLVRQTKRIEIVQLKQKFVLFFKMLHVWHAVVSAQSALFAIAFLDNQRRFVCVAFLLMRQNCVIRIDELAVIARHIFNQIKPEWRGIRGILVRCVPMDINNIDIMMQQSIILCAWTVETIEHQIAGEFCWNHVALVVACTENQYENFNALFQTFGQSTYSS